MPRATPAKRRGRRFATSLTAACSSTAHSRSRTPATTAWSTPPTTADEQLSEDLFTREIDINPLNFDGTTTVNPNLREVRVIVRYKVYNAWQTYTVSHLHLVVLLMRTDSMRPATRPRLAATAGYSLVELLVSMGMFTVIMGATLGGLADVMKGNELVMTIAAMNNSVRAGHGPDGPRPAAGGLGTARPATP